MKILISLLLVAQASFAANPNCAATSAQAAFKVAWPQGNRSSSSVYASVAGAVITKKFGSTLSYNVEIAFDTTEGYSDSFPSENYHVVATGTEKACKVISVTLVK